MPSIAKQLADVSGPTDKPISVPTAGQRAAARRLKEAVEASKPLIVLFGDTGSGKTSVVNEFLGIADANRIVALGLSSTGGDFLGPPTFDNLLQAICRRLDMAEPARQRPATLAALAASARAIVEDGKTLLVSIDHADHLTDEIIADVIRLDEYLDVSRSCLVRVFVGSLGLASRIDSIVRRLGIDLQPAEIRLSQPTAEEVATLLAYGDGAQPGGPMLTSGAIDRIGAYAKSNLHWAVPMADAARTLAESEEMREVTEEHVRRALLDIWAPEHQRLGDSSLHDEQVDWGTGAQAQATKEFTAGLSDSVIHSPDIDASSSPTGLSSAGEASTSSPRDLCAPAGGVSSHGTSQRRGTPRSRWGLLILVVGFCALAIFLAQEYDRIEPQEAGSVNEIALPKNVSPDVPENRPDFLPVESSPETSEAESPTQPVGQHRPTPFTERAESEAPGNSSEGEDADVSGSKDEMQSPNALKQTPSTSEAAGARTGQTEKTKAPKTKKAPTTPKVPIVAPPPKRPEDAATETWIQKR